MTAGLTPPELSATVAAMLGPHMMRRRLAILDLDHNHVLDVTTLFQDGQVNIDSAAQVSRSASLTLFDPTRRAGLDTANAAEGSVSPKYLIGMHRGLWVDALNRWVDIPVGVLAFTKPSRSGDVLTIEAQGKESLAQRPVWTTLVLKKGTNKVSAIRTALEQLCGEKFFRMEATTATLAADVTIGRDTNVWAVVRTIADGMGRQLFYDAEGYAVCRVAPTDPVFEFSTDRGGSITEALSVGYGGDVTNLVWATGGVPSGKSEPLQAFAVAPATHPLSPTALARGGVPQYARTDVSSDEAQTQAAVQALADTSLTQSLLQSVEVSFNALPVWHLEEGDPFMATDVSAGATVSALLSKQSIPLSPGTQSVGALRRVSRVLSSIRGGV